MLAIVQDNYGSGKALELRQVERPVSGSTRCWSASVRLASTQPTGP